MMNDRAVKHIASDKPMPWLCPICLQNGIETKLAMAQGDLVWIKHKDLYIELEGGKQLSVNCRKCGKRVSIMNTEISGSSQVPSTPNLPTKVEQGCSRP